MAERALGPEAARNHQRRVREGFIRKYLSGNAVLDIGYRGGESEAAPITEKAVGVELDYPGYDGIKLPFEDSSQDAVFASHTLEHIEDYRTALAEWYRVVKPSGFMVIAVPHQHLYERKAEPPSRFNADHRRFYTSRSLLAEIEESLPLAGYRVRSLRELDDGFNYQTPPEKHAEGSYEIELVLEKLPIPAYVEALQAPVVADRTADFFSSMILHALHAGKSGRAAKVQEVQTILRGVPLPPFAKLKRALDKASRRDPTIEGFTQDELKEILRPIIQTAAFDEAFYTSFYEDIGDFVQKGLLASGRAHYVSDGYFEGRFPAPL